MEPRLQPLPFEPGRLDGLSARLLESHHRNNYGGAVRRLHAIRAQFATLDVAAAPGYLLNGLKREELIAGNSALLHELFFDGLGGDGVLPDGPLATTLAASFGSVARWRSEFVALGKALAGGSGWVVLAWLPRDARLVNQWASDHAHAAAEAIPLLALDMYEHAYHMDFGADAAAWVDTFMRNVAWTRVAERFERAVAATTRELEIDPRELAREPGRFTVVDVRRAPIARQATTRVPGAPWFDPEDPQALAQALRDSPTLTTEGASPGGARRPGAPDSPGGAPASPVAVYCVHGHAISRMVAARLVRAGIDARCVAGGIEAWSDAQLPLEALRQ
jgi:Fe-Mn family superoxide dismutase